MISFQGLWASTSSSRWLVLCECMCMCMGLFYPQPENMPTRHSLHAPRTAFPFASTLLDSGRPTSPHSTESLLLHFPDLTSGKLCTKCWLIYQPVGTAPRVITSQSMFPCAGKSWLAALPVVGHFWWLAQNKARPGSSVSVYVCSSSLVCAGCSEQACIQVAD